MGFLSKVGGEWKSARAAYVKVSGDWKRCRQVYVKAAGEWKPCLQAGAPRTASVPSPLPQDQDTAVNLAAANGSEIEIAGTWTGSAAADGFLGVGAVNAVPISDYGIQEETGKRLYWFSKNGVQSAEDESFSLKFRATGQAVTLYLRPAEGIAVKSCRVEYICIED